GGVNNRGATFTPEKVAAAYDTNAADRSLYKDVVNPYCRPCHIAQTFYLNNPAQFTTLFSTIWTDVYGNYSMPHSERTSHNFWTGSGALNLARTPGWSLHVPRPHDRDHICFLA